MGSKCGITRLAIGSTLLAAIMAGVLDGASPAPARAGSSDRDLVALTKTTVYGGILGGLLGLASALVVKEPSRDDVIRWGVAIGTFSGFTYGIVRIARGGDDFSGATGSVNRADDPAAWAYRSCGRHGAVREGADRDGRARRLGSANREGLGEVVHEGFEEEIDGIQEARSAGRVGQVFAVR